MFAACIEHLSEKFFYSDHLCVASHYLAMAPDDCAGKLVVLTHAQNGIFDSIFDTSSPQPNGKHDGGRSVRYTSFHMFT